MQSYAKKMCLNVEVACLTMTETSLRDWKQAKLCRARKENVAVTLRLLACCFTLHYMVWAVWGPEPTSHLGRCLGLAVRDWERASRKGVLGGRRALGCRLVFFQSLPHSSIRSPKRWGGCGLEPFQTAAVTQSNMVGKSSREQQSQDPDCITYGVRAD